MGITTGGWSTGKAFVGAGGRSDGSAGAAEAVDVDDDDDEAAFDDPMFQNTMVRRVSNTDLLQAALF
jgi:hypothetical protein